MAVYVDDMRAPFGRMIMCHMVADTTEELLAMVDAIRLNPRWIQKPGTPQEHFDIGRKKRALALRAGAVEITSHRLGEIIQAKRRAALDTEEPLNPDDRRLLRNHRRAQQGLPGTAAQPDHP